MSEPGVVGPTSSGPHPTAADAGNVCASVACVDGGGSDGGVWANGSSPIGTNLNGNSDWSEEWAFVDAFKRSRPWISGSLSQWSDGRPLDLDADGWVRSLQADQVAHTFTIDGVKYHPSGRYVVLYDRQRHARLSALSEWPVESRPEARSKQPIASPAGNSATSTSTRATKSSGACRSSAAQSSAIRFSHASSVVPGP